MNTIQHSLQGLVLGQPLGFVWTDNMVMHHNHLGGGEDNILRHHLFVFQVIEGMPNFRQA